MIFAVIKFLHLLCVLSILGIVVYCCAFMTTKRWRRRPHQHPSRQRFYQLQRLLLILMLLASVTGTLLVYPNHFTYHTVWIQTAYALVAVCVLIIAGLLAYAKQARLAQPRLWLCAYCILGLILITAIHDAVTKNPFINLAVADRMAK